MGLMDAPYDVAWKQAFFYQKTITLSSAYVTDFSFLIINSGTDETSRELGSRAYRGIIEKGYSHMKGNLTFSNPSMVQEG